VDNIPYVATMAPLVHDLVSLLPQEQGPRVLWWALAIGADLGGNATIVGASANVVVLGLAGKSGHQIRFAEFARYGVVVVVVTLLVSSAYLWLRYFA
jgi:Na+/H+ antiporter NhaD/arsenite permease-like protein